MADLTNLQLIAEITSRINRPDFDGIARRVSADRIDFYKKECFYGGQATDTSISTAVGTSNYNYPTGFEQVNQIQLLNGSVWLPLAQKPYSYINNIDLVQPGMGEREADHRQRPAGRCQDDDRSGPHPACGEQVRQPTTPQISGLRRRRVSLSTGPVRKFAESTRTTNRGSRTMAMRSCGK